jgi:hypothetical protein
MRQKNFTVRPWGKFGLVLGLLGLLAGSYYVGVTNQSSSSDTQKIKVCQNYGKLPLYFIENKGQVDSRVKFYEKAGGHAIYFTPENIYFALRKKENAVKVRHMEMTSPGTSPDTQEKAAPPAVVQLTPLGMQTGVKIEAVEPQEARFNYFIGNDPAKWRTNIPSYRAVVYREAYPGIDLKFYGTGRQLEYDIMVKPGADPNRVKFQYAGIKNLEVTGTGDLAIKLPDGGQLIQKKPIVYQEITGQRLARQGKFRVEKHTAQCVYGFEVAAYDNQYPLVIDPVLSYSSYLGGSKSDYSYGIAVDRDGNVYVTGETSSDNFPIQNAFQSNLAGEGFSDAFVTKINPSNVGYASLVYSTYLGGGNADIGNAIAVDSEGNVYVTGETRSDNFPTQNAFQSDLAGGSLSDAFVTKLNAAGNVLVYSTYFGGSYGYYEFGRGIAVDSEGNAYVTGRAYSLDFPTTPGAFKTEGYYDPFVAKIDTSKVGAASLVYSTRLGGGIKVEEANSIAVDTEGKVYVTGYTANDDFPTTQNAFQPEYGGGISPYLLGADVFVTKLNPTGNGQNDLVYSTFLGGSDNEWGRGIAVDSGGNIYVTGTTRSVNFPKKNPLQETMGGDIDAFVAKIDPSKAGTASLVYSTYLGGSQREDGEGIAVDTRGNAFVTGATQSSSDFPLKNPLQETFGGGIDDAFVTKIDPSKAGTASLVYSTYLGGLNSDTGGGIAVDCDGNANLAVKTLSADLPVINGFGFPYYQSYDVFVAKIEITPHEKIQLIIEDVGALVDATLLNKGQGNSLIAKLTDALDQLDKENTHAAIQKLQEFISVVEGYIRTGKLSNEEGPPLIEAADNVISQFG